MTSPASLSQLGNSPVCTSTRAWNISAASTPSKYLPSSQPPTSPLHVTHSSMLSMQNSSGHGEHGADPLNTPRASHSRPWDTEDEKVNSDHGVSGKSTLKRKRGDNKAPPFAVPKQSQVVEDNSQSHSQPKSMEIESRASHIATKSLPSKTYLDDQIVPEARRGHLWSLVRYIKDRCERGVTRMKATFTRRRKRKPNAPLKGIDADTAKRKIRTLEENVIEREKPAVEANKFVRTIKVAFVKENNEEVIRHAKAKFDTGNPYNLISREFVEDVCGVMVMRFPEGKRRVLELPNGHEFSAIGEVLGRWSADWKEKEGLSRELRFDAKFYHARFYVSEVIERFEVVIGCETIEEHRIIDFSPRLPLALGGNEGFRSKKPPSVKGKDLKIAYDRQQAASARNSTEREDHIRRKAQGNDLSQSTTNPNTDASENNDRS